MDELIFLNQTKLPSGLKLSQTWEKKEMAVNKGNTVPSFKFPL